MPFNPRLSLAIALSGLLSACAGNPYRSSYTTLVSDKVPQAEPSALIPAEGAPRLLSSNDLKADSIKLLEGGYRPIGRSKFRSDYVEPAPALEQAQAVGAEVVLVTARHISTDTVAMPVVEWSPDQRVVQQDTQQVRSSDSDVVQSTTHESVTVIEGEYQTRYVPQTVDTYDNIATYWRKAAPPILGVLGSDVGEAERQASQSNKGLLVKIVVRKSPAFAADIFRGDIIRQLGGHEVLDADDFFEALMGMAGKTVDLRIWRDGKLLTKTVPLGAR